MSLLYCKRLFLFLQIDMVLKKFFSHIFGINRLRFCSYKLPVSENNLSEYTEDDDAARYFPSKLARSVHFVLFKFHQTLSSSVFAFKFSVEKKPFTSASIFSSIESCCSSLCVAVLDSILK